MNKYTSIVKIQLLLAFLIVSMSGCNEVSPDTATSIKLNLKSYIDDENNFAPSLKEVDVFLFKSGILSDMYKNTLGTNNELIVDFNDVNGASIFIVADPSKMTDYSYLKKGESRESDFLKAKTKELNTEAREGISPFYVGMKSINAISDNIIDLSRGTARFDINMDDAPNTVVKRVKFTNVAAKSYVFNQAEDITDIMDFEKIFTTPIATTTKGACNLLEQKTGDSELEIEVEILNLKSIIRKKLPSPIERNKIYDIVLSTKEGEVEVTVAISEWEDGDDIDTTPSLDKAKIDVLNSEYPSYFRISPTLDTLFIPSGETTFKLGISSSTEITVESDDLTLTAIPTSDPLSLKYEIATTSRLSNKVVDLKIKYKNLDNSYEDKIVLFMEKSKAEFSGTIFDHFKDNGDIKFDKYIDGVLGSIRLPSTSFITLDSDWIRLEAEDTSSPDSLLFTVRGGFRPNNMRENGTIQKSIFTIVHTTEEVEHIEISRINNSLPVVDIDGQYWCMYNLQGNSRKFEDQILTVKDDLYEYLKTCSDEEFAELSGDGYRGTDPVGLNLKAYEVPSSTEGEAPTKKFSFENYAISSDIGYTGSVETCPDGYMIPESIDFDNIIKFIRGGTPPIMWNNPKETPMELGWFSRINPKVDNLNFIHNVNVYYSKSKKEDTAESPNSKLALFGFGYQESVMDFKYFQALFTMGSTGLFWGVFNTTSSLDSQGGHRPTPATIRYIRCVKKPDFFLY